MLLQIPAQTDSHWVCDSGVSTEVEWESECGSQIIEHVSVSACRDQQEAVGMGMGMELPVEAREGQWACECSCF